MIILCFTLYKSWNVQKIINEYNKVKSLDIVVEQGIYYIP